MLWGAVPEIALMSGTMLKVWQYYSRSWSEPCVGSSFCEKDEDIFVYTRSLADKTWLIACNFFCYNREFTIPLEHFDDPGVIIANYADFTVRSSAIELRPYEAVVLWPLRPSDFPNAVSWICNTTHIRLSIPDTGVNRSNFFTFIQNYAKFDRSYNIRHERFFAGVGKTERTSVSVRLQQKGDRSIIVK